MHFSFIVSFLFSGIFGLYIWGEFLKICMNLYTENIQTRESQIVQKTQGAEVRGRKPRKWEAGENGKG